MGWDKGAKQRLEKAPVFVRGMARAAIEEEAKKQGYKMITEKFVSEVMDNMMPKAVREGLMKKGS
ncbi:MAG: PCP reductase family protein [Nitrospinae bacterium]|nr:PCP reductase family protein [Nitrospinota bacterium]